MPYFDINNYNIHKNAINKLKKWLIAFENQKDDPNIPDVAIIYGPPGSGKTSLVNSIFKHFNYDIVEFVPDYTKTHKYEIKRLDDMLNVNNIMMMINNIKKGILFDDIDIGTPGDRGFVSDIITILEKKKKSNLTKNKNPLILTINNKVSNKKTKIINKYSEVIYLDRLTPCEIFNIGKFILKDVNIISDINLRLLCNSCQGDIRNIYQKIKGYKLQFKKELSNNNNNNYLDIVTLHDSEQSIKNINKVFSCKDLEIKCLPTVQKYCNPNIDVNYEQYQYLYNNDPLFVPAFVYQNSWELLSKVNIKKKKKLKTYHNILNSLCDWCEFDNIYYGYNCNIIYEYNCFTGVIYPLTKIRTLRKQFNWENHQFYTSNLYSRISQASFNGRSLCELSEQLHINTNEYHLFTYILYQLFILNDKDLSNELINYLKLCKINAQDIDRLFRYNCLSKKIDKDFNTKNRSFIRKILNNG